MDDTNETKSDRKARRKVASAAALDRDSYKVTDFGRKQRNTLPGVLRRVFDVLMTPVTFVLKWRSRWQTRLKDAADAPPAAVHPHGHSSGFGPAESSTAPAAKDRPA